MLEVDKTYDLPQDAGFVYECHKDWTITSINGFETCTPFDEDSNFYYEWECPDVPLEDNWNECPNKLLPRCKNGFHWMSCVVDKVCRKDNNECLPIEDVVGGDLETIGGWQCPLFDASSIPYPVRLNAYNSDCGVVYPGGEVPLYSNLVVNDCVGQFQNISVLGAVGFCTLRADGVCRGTDTMFLGYPDCTFQRPQLDKDNDGFLITEDCDDTNASIYPGAEELCNGVDDDCDGSPSLQEIDVDGDGFMVCENDCDDYNHEVNPEASEVVCNLLDDDCDGVIDECPYWTAYSEEYGGEEDPAIPTGDLVIGPVPAQIDIDQKADNLITGMASVEFSYEDYPCEEMTYEELGPLHLNYDSLYKGYATDPFPGMGVGLNFAVTVWTPSFANTDSPAEKVYVCVSATVGAADNSGDSYPGGQFRAVLTINGNQETVFFPSFTLDDSYTPIPERSFLPFEAHNRQSGLEIEGRIRPQSSIDFYFREDANSAWKPGPSLTARSVCEAHSNGDSCDPEGNAINIGVCRGITNFYPGYCEVESDQPEQAIITPVNEIHEDGIFRYGFGRLSKPQSCVYHGPFQGCQVLDADEDGFKNASFLCSDCTDCDDFNASINPAEEDLFTGDGDQNCNGLDGEQSSDQDDDDVLDLFDRCVGQDHGGVFAIVDYFGCWISPGHKLLKGWSKI